MPFLEPLHKVMNRGDLSAAEAHAAMQLILRGEVTTPRLAAFLAALRVKGETAAELEGFARAMRAGCVRIDHGITAEPVLDVVGTGGDLHNTINVSTFASFVAAAAGVRVAVAAGATVTAGTALAPCATVGLCAATDFCLCASASAGQKR